MIQLLTSTIDIFAFKKFCGTDKANFSIYNLKESIKDFLFAKDILFTPQKTQKKSNTTKIRSSSEMGRNSLESNDNPNSSDLTFILTS